ncbi:hypothetical protein C8R43DRAFT_1241181 [Mycena crocata]|nr:hypothetical protein C8R43DRAFT_1241181 [Mycena crocata]
MGANHFTTFGDTQVGSLLSHLRTGYVPTSTETKGLQTDLISLTKELARLETLIQDLSARRDKIEESIQLHQAVLAPVRRLPDDVLQDIFLACLPTHRNAVMSTREAPLLLCRVCRTWRALALATPRIWASLHIHLGFILQGKQRAQALTQWLQRAAGCPLSLSICGTLPGAQNGAIDRTPLSIDSSGSEHEILLDALVKSTTRWHNVALTDLHTSYVQELRATSTPMLQSLQIRDRAPLAHWVDVFSSPGIRTLTLEVMIVEEDGPLLLPALSLITHLSISSNTNGPWGPFGIPGSLAHNIFPQLTQLVSLKIVVQEVLAASSGTTHFPVLESLDLRVGNAELSALDALLDHLTMPHLCHLSVDAPVMPGSNAPFFATLRTSSPQLRSLEIGLSSFTHETLRGTLPHLAPLTRLVVRDSSGWHPDPELPLADTEILLLLLTEPALANAFTELRELKIVYSRGVEEETLFKFLETRVDAGGEFRLSVDLNYGHNTTLPDVDRFRAEGLDISLIKTTKPWTMPAADAWTGLPRELRPLAQ